MDTKTNESPKIRFAGFTDTWERRKLGEVANIVGGGTPSTTTKEYWGGNINWYSPVEIGEQIYVDNSRKKITKLGLQKSSAKILPIGTILFTSRAGIGNTAILSKEAATNQGFQSIVPHKNALDSYFIYSRTNELKRFGEKTGAGSTFIEVSGKQMAKMSISLPTIAEQIKIGNFFKEVDNLITSHRRKLELLKEMKKALLQRMFPKDGANAPEIRFSGFTDTWEQRKLGELFQVTRGRVLAATKTSRKKTNSTPYPVYSSQTKDRGLMGYYNDYLFKDAITWTTDGANAGTVNYREGKFYCTNVCGVLISEDGYANRMVSEILNSVAWKYVSKVGNPKLMNNVMSEIVIPIPTLDEQIKIGNFFKDMDNLITLQQEEINSLEDGKKTLLRQMFI